MNRAKKIEKILIDNGLSSKNKGVNSYLKNTPTFEAVKSIVESEVAKIDVLSITIKIVNDIANAGRTKGYYITEFLKRFKADEKIATDYILDYIDGIKPETIEKYRMILSEINLIK